MMETKYTEYLSLLQTLNKTLGELTATAKEKAAAIRASDLIKLDACIKREQALSLSLRGTESKRETMLRALGLSDIPLSGLAAKYPESLQTQAAKIAETLLTSFRLYRSASEVTRTTLEVNLHQIEQMLYGENTPPPSNPEPPARMKADIRA